MRVSCEVRFSNLAAGINAFMEAVILCSYLFWPINFSVSILKAGKIWALACILHGTCINALWRNDELKELSSQWVLSKTTTPSDF
jgi:hypothetical protein